MKKIILSLLTLSLMYSPLSAFDWSYNALTNSISNYWNGVKEDPAKAVACVFLAGIAAFLGYAMYKHYQEGSLRSFSDFEEDGDLNETIMIGNSECQGKELTIADNTTIKQLKVVNQGDRNGGGYASCGYHALKNTNYIAGCLESSNSNLNDIITNKVHVQDLFGQRGSWRTLIIYNRSQRVLKNYIYNRLKGLIKEKISEDESDHMYKKDKIIDLLKTCLDILAGSYAKQILGSTQPVTIESENIQALLLGDLANKIDCLQAEQWREDWLVNKKASVTQQDLKDYICNEETIAQFIDPLRKPLNISLQDLKPAFEEYNRGNNNPVSSEGDWLNADEIEELNKQEQSSQRFPLTIIEDASVNTIDHQTLKEIRTKLNNDQDDYIHKFILGTMTRYKNSDSGTRGHWFTCVFFKHGSKRDYIIADSLNMNRLGSPIVHRLIRQLEGQSFDHKEVIETKEESD